METSAKLERRSTGKWYAIGGLTGIIIAVLVPVIGYLFLVSVLLLVFGLLKWTYEASIARALQTGEAHEPGRVASIVFFTEITLLGLFALGFSAIALLVIGLGDPAPGVDLETERNQAALVVLGFLGLSVGVLAWGINRWAYRKRSAFLIPVLVPVAATIAFVAARLLFRA